MNVFAFYDGETVHARPSCSRKVGKVQRRRVTLFGDHPGDSRAVKLRTTAASVVVAGVCPVCWPDVFNGPAWRRNGARPRAHTARQVA